MGLQKELAVLHMQDKRMPIDWGDLFDFLGSDSELTSSRSSWKRKKGQAFPPISYGELFPNDTGMLGPVDEQMLTMLASASAPVVGPLVTPLMGNPPTSRIAPPWGKGAPPISVTGMLPRLLGNT